MIIIVLNTNKLKHFSGRKEDKSWIGQENENLNVLASDKSSEN